MKVILIPFKIYSLAVVDKNKKLLGFVHTEDLFKGSAEKELFNLAKSFGKPFGKVFSISKGPFSSLGRPSYKESNNAWRF